MAKIQFDARKDPLLRKPSTRRDARAPESGERAEAAADGAPQSSVTPASAAEAGADVTAMWVDRRERRASPRSSPANGSAVEAPAGVIAVEPPEEPARPRRRRSAPTTTADAHAAKQPDGSPREERARGGARRIQTSVSLSPAVWDILDDLSRGAGATNGELLTAILSAAIPEDAQAAMTLVERLLTAQTADEGLYEERNYRLPLELRGQLDAIAQAIAGGPRPQRSLLVRSIIAAAAPETHEAARALITSRRIEAMRASMASSPSA